MLKADEEGVEVEVGVGVGAGVDIGVGAAGGVADGLKSMVIENTLFTLAPLLSVTTTLKK